MIKRFRVGNRVVIQRIDNDGISQELIPDREDICQSCGKELKPIWENNGFDEPDPTHLEITGHEPCKCQDEDE
jgi:hypothetical protein